jgi:hypothetical protein
MLADVELHPHGHKIAKSAFFGVRVPIPLLFVARVMGGHDA